MKARAVNVRIEPWDVYVGRGAEPKTGRRLMSSRWGNPFPVSKHGAAKCMALYFQHLEQDPARVERARLELAGKRLGCWCKPGPCHADVLAGLANGRSLAEIKKEWAEAGLLAETGDLFAEEAR